VDEFKIMDHTESIVELKNIISPEFLKRIIPLIKHKAKNPMKVNGGIIKNVRNVKGYSLTHQNPTDLFYWNLVKSQIERIYFHYKAKFPKMASNKINQIDLLRYISGGKYETHTDHFTNTPRHLSIIINLNDDYEGGDLIFTDQKDKEIKRLKLNKGTIVFFPSNFMYPHMIEPITKGTRYSIVAWLQ
jgi:predicted 2-oxoglutarate/Fe(II)-dependent dioxygenase YbiX